MRWSLANRIRPRGLLLVAAESVMITAAIALATYARFGEWIWELVKPDDVLLKAVLITFVCQVCLYYGDLYELTEVTDRRDLFVRILQSLGAASFVLAAIYFWFPTMMIGRGVFLLAASLIIMIVIGWRFAFDWVAQQVGPRERLLLVGVSASAVNLARELFGRRHELGVEIVGFVDSDPERVGETVFNPRVIGTIEDIPAIVRARSVDRVVVSLADARGKLPMGKLLDMKLNGVSFDHLASVYEEYTGKIAVENLRPSWLIFSSGFQGARVLKAAKRLMDIGIAAVALVVTAPLMLLVALVVRATSHGKALYHQERVGRHGRIFTVHKFRSMQVDAEASSGPVWASPNDARVTSVGRFLRRTRLDELPQLWNVLVGEMSLVGPRPERPKFVEELTREIPFYGQRQVVRPGITGWAQVRYTYGASKEDALEKLQYDLFYIKNLSIALDLFIILETIKTVVLRRGAA
jgi:sugar transferase (PEP-CTERM system associated)